MFNSPELYQDTVDCTIEPYNLYPVVDALMSAENWLLKNIPKGQKVVLILAEDHRVMTDVALRQAVLSAHVKQFWHDPTCRFAFGFEGPHNKYAPDIMINSQKLLEKVAEDPDLSYQKETNRQLFAFCLEHGIDTRFNDIADYKDDNGNDIIDQNDPLTRDIIANSKTALLDEDDIIRESDYLSTTLGLTLSNMAIVENAKTHIRETQSRLYIQDCGFTHALGDKGELAYKDSLAYLFRNAGFAVITLIPSLRKFVPSDALNNEHIIFSESLIQSKTQTKETWETIDDQSLGLLTDPSAFILPHERPAKLQA